MPEMIYQHKDFGGIHLQTTDKGLYSIKRTSRRSTKKSEKHPILEKTTKQLDEFFSGRRDQFDLPLDLEGTDFQKKVWKQLLKIPFGKTLSYSQLAKKIGAPNASRAVGTACGKNPIPIVVPCHRVLAKDQKLGGFGWGLPYKKRLLQLEGAEYLT
jgi:methylated-DNA-[protein]-cysteine S-methyltransferase